MKGPEATGAAAAVDVVVVVAVVVGVSAAVGVVVGVVVVVVTGVGVVLSVWSLLVGLSPSVTSESGRLRPPVGVLVGSAAVTDSVCVGVATVTGVVTAGVTTEGVAVGIALGVVVTEGLGAVVGVVVGVIKETNGIGVIGVVGVETPGDIICSGVDGTGVWAPEVSVGVPGTDFGVGDWNGVVGCAPTAVCFTGVEVGVTVGVVLGVEVAPDSEVAAAGCLADGDATTC